jgi:hypothetical protein
MVTAMTDFNAMERDEEPVYESRTRMTAYQGKSGPLEC